MRPGGSQSWQIRVARAELHYDLALWIRAAERIPVQAGGLVPGPLDLDPAPVPSALHGAGLVAGWLDWWYELANLPRAGGPGRPARPPEAGYGPPNFDSLAGWPALQAIAVRRWRQGHAWHTARRPQSIERQRALALRETEIVRDVESSLGRRVGPFTLEFIVLPVRDDEVRMVSATRYLVPEQVYDAEGWASWLARLVTSLG
jgi:hypothetical protein